MSGKHIPGPWFYGQESADPEWYIVTIKGGLIIANVNAHHHQEANARLIAAAPDLLDFVKWVAAQGEPNNQMEIFKRARLLAAKAEGRAP